MGITVNEVQKLKLSERRILDIFRRHPFVEQEIQKELEAEEAEERRARDQALDALEANGHRMRQLDKEISAQLPRSDAARDAWRREDEKLGTLMAQRQQLQAHEGRLCLDLELAGDAPVQQALQILDGSVHTIKARISELQALTSNAKRNEFSGEFSQWHMRNLAELSKLRPRLKRIEDALKLARPWIGARVSPREQIARIEALMASLTE